jgi:protein SCO1/2
VNGRGYVALALLAITACAAPVAPTTRAPAHRPSVFDRPWIWTDEQDAPVRLERWRGQTLIVAFVYTTCTTVCPLTVEKLRGLDERLRRAGRPAELVLVTLDPWTDSAAQLRSFKSERRLPERWHLLRAHFEQTHALADLLQVRLIDDGAHVIHDGTIAVLDGAGRPVGYVTE